MNTPKPNGKVHPVAAILHEWDPADHFQTLGELENPGL
jgi:hypothetical protein